MMVTTGEFASAAVLIGPPDGRSCVAPGSRTTLGPAALWTGDPAPAFCRADVSGTMVALADFVGRQVVVLFWNPRCGYCQQMRRDLQVWDAASRRQERALVVISSGSDADHQRLRMRSPVLSDPAREVARSYQAWRTPAAALVDADGRMATWPVTGAPAVFQLLYSSLYPSLPPMNCVPRV
jgi:peroxiredoxin